MFIIFATCTLEFQAWLKHEIEDNYEYIQSTGKKQCNDGDRTNYNCYRTRFHKEMYVLVEEIGK